MKNLMKATIVSFAVMSIAGIAGAQQLAPQKVLTDLSAEQITALNGLGAISNSEATTSPAYDFHVKQILTPAQFQQYNKLKDGERDTANKAHNIFNIDSK